MVIDVIAKKEEAVSQFSPTQREDIYNNGFAELCKATYPAVKVSVVANKNFTSVYEKTPKDLRDAARVV